MKLTNLIIAGFFLAGISAQARTIRATDLSSSIWTEIGKGKLSDVTIEFKQGDELPVSFSAEGDLFQTTQTSVGYVGIKKNFWIKLQNNNILMSLDNSNFKDIKEVISGSFEAGTDADQNGGLANALNLALKAFLK
ncbi:MAG: hypothetical protein IPM97_07115 [Bdellovibrionaceae bacterium]|nr:hypothetical protein [Pseudobdellovibrionaceae bacterium]